MDLISYENFEILINRWDGERYATRVLSSPAGETQGEFSLSALVPDVAANLQSLRELVLGVAGATRTQAERWSQARQLGELLFDALMSGEVRSCFDVSLNDTRRTQQGLRLRLRIEPPELAALPWELMYDQRSGRFLSLSKFTPIVRYIQLQQAIRPFATERPLRVLVVMSSPGDMPPLDVEAEIRQLTQALSHVEKMGTVKVTILREADLLTIQKLLRDEEFNVLHYMGHGHFSPGDQEGYLVFEDSRRSSYAISGRKLGRLLHDEDTLRLVVLNACSTAVDAEAAPFSGVAASLVQAGIPAVVAMQTRISDRAARQFSQVFYESLAEGYPIDGAVGEGRKAIDFSAHQTVEWAVPLLFMRVEDGVLFNFGSPARVKSARRPEKAQEGPPASPRTQPQPAPARKAVSAPPPRPPQVRPTPAPTADAEKPMQRVPASAFIFGAGEVRELPEFYIDAWPVTNAEYQRFVVETGAETPSTWPRGKFPRDKVDHPVTGVSWHAALAYATWAGKRLPTAAEWEKAARGTEGRRYPWGEDFEIKCCNTSESGLGDTTPVKQHSAGASPYGLLDLAGNVWEWTSDEVKPRGLGRQRTKRVLKGGAFNAPQGAAECAAQTSAWPDDRLDYVGFRCVRSSQGG